MKKMVLLVCFVCFLMVTVFVCLPVLLLAVSQGNADEIFLESSVSPDGAYTLEAYRTQPGATVDFSIKVYSKTDSRKKVIYNAYHEDTVEIKWISGSEVCINGKTLDLSQKETYDWRKDT